MLRECFALPRDDATERILSLSMYSCRERALARLCLAGAPPCLEQAMQATRTCPWLVPQLIPLAP